MNLSRELDFSVLMNMIFVFKQKNIAFRYLLTITNTSFIKSFNCKSNIRTYIIVYFREILLQEQFKLILGLNKFFSDFFLFLLLKQSSKLTYLDFCALKNSKGLIKYIYPYMNQFKDKALFTFFFFFIVKKSNNFFQIEEVFEIKNFENFFLRLSIETNQIFKIVTLGGIIDIEFFFKKYQIEFLKFKNSYLESLYHFYRKQIKIKESAIISRYLKKKAKLLQNFRESIKNNTFEKIIFGCEVSEIRYFIKFYEFLIKKKT